MNGRLLYLGLFVFFASIGAQAGEIGILTRVVSRIIIPHQNVIKKPKASKKENFITPTVPTAENKEVFNHIFPKKGKAGHLPPSPENHAKIVSLVNNPNNYKGKDRFGKDWFFQGNMWAYAKNGTVISGGMSRTPNDYRLAKEAGLKITDE